MDDGWIIEADGVHRTYSIETSPVEVLKGVTLRIRRGELVAIMGASGAGKSTLLHILGGLDHPTAGRVRFDGRDLYGMPESGRADIRALRIGFVFQAYHLLPELDVLDNVVLPSMSRFGLWRQGASNRRRALELLDRVGLAGRARHRPAELSGGEQQRVALARALMNGPEVLLADEPTGNLDTATGEQVLHYLFDLTKERGHTVVLVTHNDAVAARCARRLQLVDGCLA
ncbi:MAG: Lipoprotein-releasing system ATP-binding protein LolD [Verrucomicrobia bacterium ADurb.Bin345]|nr:MAG: Lipoprotein-releasing system ATP-binding protein LolD [Verrucomicrobia bacterium ADurb.Bin345]